MKFIQFIKLSLFFILVTLLAVGLNSLSGNVVFAIQGINIEMPVSFFLIGILSVFAVLLFIKAVWQALWHIPERYHSFLEKKRRIKAQNLIIDSGAALVALQPEEARVAAQLAHHLVPDDPIVLYMAAKTAHESGNMEKAVPLFNQMTKQPRLRFLGLCGLIADAKIQKDHLKLYDLLREVIKLRHDSSWILKELQENDLKLLERDIKPKNDKDILYKLLQKDDWHRHYSLRLLIQAQKQIKEFETDLAKETLKKAIYESPEFIWPSIELIKSNDFTQFDKKTYKMIIKSAQINPHPMILDHLLMIGGYQTPTVAYQFLSEQLSHNHYESLLFLSNLALKASLWDVARQLAEKALQSYPTMRSHKQLTDILSALNLDQGATKLTELHSDYGWICKDCGDVHAQYHVFCPSCDAMDSIEYMAAHTHRKIKKVKKQDFMMAS